MPINYLKNCYLDSIYQYSFLNIYKSQLYTKIVNVNFKHLKELQILIPYKVKCFFTAHFILYSIIFFQMTI